MVGILHWRWRFAYREMLLAKTTHRVTQNATIVCANKCFVVSFLLFVGVYTQTSRKKTKFYLISLIFCTFIPSLICLLLLFSLLKWQIKNCHTTTAALCSCFVQYAHTHTHTNILNVHSFAIWRRHLKHTQNNNSTRMRIKKKTCKRQKNSKAFYGEFVQTHTHTWKNQRTKKVKINKVLVHFFVLIF